MTQIGYYRIAPTETPHCRALQVLQEHGCSVIEYDRCFPGGVLRSGLDAALSSLQEDDILVVPNLHALAGSVVDLFAVLHRLKGVNAHLVSLREGVDTRADFGFIATCDILKNFNEQRFVVAAAERMLANKVGAPPKIDDIEWLKIAPRLERGAKDRLTLEGAAAALRVSRSTVVRKMQAAKE
jgi:DNA invertase Pin-like site-specific DNA recombinase